MTNPTEQIAQLKASMEALEAQRSVLGDEAVDLALKELRQQLVELEVKATPPESIPETPLSQVSSSTSTPEPVSPQALSEANTCLLATNGKTPKQTKLMRRVARTFRNAGWQVLIWMPMDQSKAQRPGLQEHFYNRN